MLRAAPREPTPHVVALRELEPQLLQVGVEPVESWDSRREETPPRALVGDVEKGRRDLRMCFQRPTKVEVKRGVPSYVLVHEERAERRHHRRVPSVVTSLPSASRGATKGMMAPMSDGATRARTETCTALGAHREAWDALVAQQPLPSPFLRSWWVENAVGHRPCLVLVLDGETLIGGLALEEDLRLGVPRLLAAGSALAPDHVDLIAAPGRCDDVVGALAQWFRRPGSRLVDLSLTPTPARVADALPRVIENEVVEEAYWAPLPSTFESYYGARPSQLRNSVDRTRRRLTREGVTYHRAAPAEVGAALDALRRLHGAVFGETSHFLPFFERFARVASAGVAAGELTFHQLRAGTQVIATTVTFETCGRLSYYQAGRDPDQRWRGAGVYLERLLLEQAWNDGLREFDHLRGREEYKRAWVGETRPLSRLVACSGPLGRASYYAFEVATDERLRGALRRARELRSAAADRGRLLRRHS